VRSLDGTAELYQPQNAKASILLVPGTVKASLFAAIAIFASILLDLSGLARQEAPTAPTRTEQAHELVIEQIKKTVVFIETATRTSTQGSESALGTGFLISVPEPRAGKDLSIMWLATAKHVLRQTLPDGTPGPFLRQIKIRYNLKKPADTDGSYFKELPIDVSDQDGHVFWIVDPDDDSVDIALTPVAIDADKADIRMIGIDQFLSVGKVKEMSVNENDEILFAGLFEPYQGTKKIYPIVRHGKLALVPEEKIPVRFSPSLSLTEEIYLAEITSFSGNSGSPVFLRFTPLRETAGINLSGNYSYLLLGVMQGFFNEAELLSIQVSELRGVAGQNSGIALVVPAERLLAILRTKYAEAQTLWILGNTYSKQERFEEAAGAYKGALDALEKAVDGEHPLLANLMQAYAALLRKTGRPGLAKFLESRAQAILAKHAKFH
jgi:hypothetical protein